MQRTTDLGAIAAMNAIGASGTACCIDRGSNSLAREFNS